MNAGENDIVIMPATFGLGLDPSTRKRDRDPTLFGTGKWHRVLIDATINLDYDPDPDFGGARYPPTVWPIKEDEDGAGALEGTGLDKLKRVSLLRSGRLVGLMLRRRSELEAWMPSIETAFGASMRAGRRETSCSRKPSPSRRPG